jgi:hypothetical protein
MKPGRRFAVVMACGAAAVLTPVLVYRRLGRLRLDRGRALLRLAVRLFPCERRAHGMPTAG